MHSAEERIERRQEERSVSLNEKARRAELDDLEARREAFRAAMKELPAPPPVARVITVAKSPPAPAPAATEDEDAQDATESRDIVLQEALRILSDLVLLRGGGRFAP